jgi:hypothetical protein
MLQVIFLLDPVLGEGESRDIEIVGAESFRGVDTLALFCLSFGLEGKEPLTRGNFCIPLLAFFPLET